MELSEEVKSYLIENNFHGTLKKMGLSSIGVKKSKQYSTLNNIFERKFTRLPKSADSRKSKNQLSFEINPAFERKRITEKIMKRKDLALNSQKSMSDKRPKKESEYFKCKESDIKLFENHAEVKVPKEFVQIVKTMGIYEDETSTQALYNNRNAWSHLKSDKTLSCTAKGRYSGIMCFRIFLYKGLNGY